MKQYVPKPAQTWTLQGFYDEKKKKKKNLHRHFSLDPGFPSGME